MFLYKIIINCFIFLLLTGCTTTQTPIFIPAKPVAIPSTVREVPSKTNYRLHYGSDPALEHAFKQYLRTGRAANIITEGFVKFAYNADQEPIIKTAPLQETVVSLEPGEKFSNISSGDPSRWSYAVALSGQGATQQQNILIKPSLPDISTNMVITTNKRIYNLRLVSCAPDHVSDIMHTVRFWYPDDMRAATQTAFDTTHVAADIPLNHLNFDYSINAPGWFSALPRWAPTRVFDDGLHTYIKFPENVSTTDMPVLFVLRNQQNELVNYRYQDPYFIVDCLFKQAVLVLGVGSSQIKVTITNHRLK